MTDNEKLAEFCGLVKSKHGDEGRWWTTKSGVRVTKVAEDRWAKDPYLWYMVLEALVKKLGATISLEIWQSSKLGGMRCDIAFGGFDWANVPFPQAIIDAAMEVIKSEGA